MAGANLVHFGGHLSNRYLLRGFVPTIGHELMLHLGCHTPNTRSLGDQ